MVDDVVDIEGVGAEEEPTLFTIPPDPLIRVDGVQVNTEVNVLKVVWNTHHHTPDQMSRTVTW